MPGDNKIYGFNKDDTIELLNLIGNADGEFPEGPFGRDIGGGSGGTGLAKTPSGGIPARSSITAGVATCTLAELYDDSGTIKIREKSPTESVEIYNSTSVTISGGAWIHWKTDGSYKVIDVDDCSSSSGISLNGGTP